MSYPYNVAVDRGTSWYNKYISSKTSHASDNNFDKKWLQSIEKSVEKYYKRPTGYFRMTKTCYLFN